MKISRRDFLVGAGAGVVVTGAAAAGYLALQQPETVEVIKEVPVEVQVPGETIVQTVGPTLPASMRAVSMNIDGKAYNVIVDVRESLWDTMTHKLGLRDRVNVGCDRAECGVRGVGGRARGERVHHSVGPFGTRTADFDCGRHQQGHS
jgi:hypothetical protein